MPVTTPQSSSKRHRSRLSVLERLSEYKKGSIRRVRLQNFLTYADVEFSPGPRLNVVIGPNGTGKSTILCAICLGLGGQPTLLGRADDARTFIMHEKDRAFIEVELTPKEPCDKGDIIRRIIDRNKGSERGRGVGASTFYINGSKSNLKSVKELVEKYHIAVDNLCTFLPQDRVGSFSGFTPKDLLIETEKAIGMETMYEPHLELQKLEDEVSNEGNEKESIEERLNALKQENERLEREKERMEERKKAIQQKKLLMQKLVWLQFDQARETAVKLKEERDKCKKELQEARKVLRPLEQKAEKLDAELQRIKARNQDSGYAAKLAVSEFDKAMNKYGNFQDKIEEETTALTSIDSIQRQNLKEAEKHRQRVQGLEAALHSDFPPVEEAEHHLKLAQTEIREIKKRNDQAKRENHEVATTYRDLETQIQTGHSKLERMKDEKKRRQERLFRQLPKLGEAFQFVDQNRKMFRRPIWGPIAGEVSMKSANAAAYLEQHVSNSILKSFVVECKEDYNLLYRELRTKRGIPVNINIVNNGKLNEIRRIYSDEKMKILQREHGVIGYLDESFDAPDAILQALRTSSSVHAVLVGNDKTEESLERRGLLDFLVEKEDGSPGKMNACIFSRDGNKAYKYTSMVSRYSGKSSIRVDEINAARMLAPGTNPEMRERLEIELESKRRKLEDLKPKRMASEEKVENTMKEGQAASSRIKDMKAAIRAINAHQTKIAYARKKLRDCERNADRDCGAEKKKVVNTLKKLVELSLIELKNLARSQEDILDSTRSLTGVRMTEDGIAASAQRARDTLNDKKQESLSLEEHASHMSARFTEAKRRMKGLKIKADEIAPMKDSEGNDLPLKAKLQELPETLGEVEDAIADTEDIISNITDNPEVLRLYEERKKEIKKIEDDFQNLENAQSAKKAKLVNLLSDWKSRLENTVTKVNGLFSDYMADLGCAGEIKLAYGGSVDGNSNFSDWGIEIRVKFREKSSLQVLSAQVQSGGERSVSTIMYLMALQELMKSPFRCVDEINQGLDERNERLVFRRIVKNSTKSPEGKRNNHCGQYFLITPKLLPNLTDMENENITILFIFNGPFNFSHFSDWSCDKFIGYENDLPESNNMKQSLKENGDEIEGNEDDENDENLPSQRKGSGRRKRRMVKD